MTNTAVSQDARATVRLDGRALFRVGALEGQDARTRARQIEQRLSGILENPSSGLAARVTQVAGKEDRLISIAGRPIVTVTFIDAEENGTTPELLAAQWASAINSGLARAIERRLSGADRFVAAVQSSVQTAFARVGESAITIIPKMLAAVLVIAVFWSLAASVRWTMRIVFRRIVSDLTVENLIKQVGYYAVWALGLIVAAGAFGLEPQDVATGLGLTSLALGFALKDILSNFVSGLLILTLRPFQIGDQIVIGNTEGSVERIELRATLIRTYDGRRVAVPNSETFTSRVTNNTASPVRRAAVQMPLQYGIDLPAAADAMRRAAKEVDGVLAEPPPSVRVRTLEKDGLVLEVRFWTDSRRSDYVATTSKVRIAIVAALAASGVPLPDSVIQVSLSRSPEAHHGGGMGSTDQEL